MQSFKFHRREDAVSQLSSDIQINSKTTTKRRQQASSLIPIIGLPVCMCLIIIIIIVIITNVNVIEISKAAKWFILRFRLDALVAVAQC